MKCAILGTRGIPALYGGFETFAQELSTRLVSHGHEVTVYCEGCTGTGPSDYHGVRLMYAPTVNLGPFSTILFDIRCLWHARKGFDVVYMLGYGAGAFCFIPRLWGTTVWINMDGVEWARSKWNRIAKLWFKLMEGASLTAVDRVIADAEAIHLHLQSRHGSMPACTVIPYGSPVVASPPAADILNEWQLMPNRYYLIVCRLEPENSLREIITGYLKSASVMPLIIVGNAAATTRFVRNLRSLGNSRVRFIGTVFEPAKLTALRFHAFAYFHGHTVGGTNPSLLEALGCGNVILAHDNVFNREVAGDAAFYFRTVHEIPDLIGKIEGLSGIERQDVRREAQDRILREYTWEHVVDRYEHLLSQKRQSQTSGGGT